MPANAKAVSLNLTATEPGQNGHLRIIPAGLPLPLVSTLNFQAGQTRANNAVVPLAGGGVDLFGGLSAGTVHVILDVNGYFD